MALLEEKYWTILYSYFFLFFNIGDLWHYCRISSIVSNFQVSCKILSISASIYFPVMPASCNILRHLMASAAGRWAAVASVLCVLLEDTMLRRQCLPRKLPASASRQESKLPGRCSKLPEHAHQADNQPLKFVDLDMVFSVYP